MSRLNQLTAIAGVLAIGLSAPTARISAQQAAPPSPFTRITADGQGVGPQVGERVPDFNLPDSHGAMHTLASIMGAKGATIIFIRSADWCPPCKAHLIEMQ